MLSLWLKTRGNHIGAGQLSHFYYTAECRQSQHKYWRWRRRNLLDEPHWVVFNKNNKHVPPCSIPFFFLMLEILVMPVNCKGQICLGRGFICFFSPLSNLLELLTSSGVNLKHVHSTCCLLPPPSAAPTPVAGNYPVQPGYRDTVCLFATPHPPISLAISANIRHQSNTKYT